jgi:hypothetical protein
VGDGLGLVVSVQVPGRLGEGVVRPATEHDALFLFGHGGDEGPGVLGQGLTGHASTYRHHHVDDQVGIVNQIMVHEATEDSDRLRWMVERHVRPLYDAIGDVWQRLRDAGIAAPVDPTMVHYVIVGAASMPFVNAPEARLLTGVEPADPAWVDTHADGLVATLLPGLAQARGGLPGVPLRKGMAPR